MSYRELLPHPALRPYVDRLWISSSDAPVGERRILPDGCIDLIVDLAGGGARDPVAVGAMTRAVLIPPAASARVAAVRFRPGGAQPFLRAPAAELTDRVVACADLEARWLTRAPFDGVGDPADPMQAAQLLQSRLLERLPAVGTPDPLVAHAVRALFAPEPPSIAALGRQAGWSRQHLGRLFRRHVGVTPKQLARVARMQRAVSELQRDRRAGLAAVAAGLGYFDQAHMTLDFRDLAGVTPAEARAAAGSILPIPSLLTGA